MKDFIAPTPVNLNNCATVIIRKQTDPDGTAGSWTFTPNANFIVDPGVDNGEPAQADPFNLSDDGVKTFTNVLQGTGLEVTETQLPNFKLIDIDCSASTGVSVTTSLADKKVTFDVDSPSDVVDCTFTNQLQLGAILVTKTAKHAADGPGDHPQAGVDFTVNGDTKATNESGQACFDGLAFGAHNVTETVPAGYVGEGDSTTTVVKSVTVDNVAYCDDNPYVGEEVSFSNTPLTDITVSVDSQIDGGTASTIECVDESDSSVASGSTGANGDGSRHGERSQRRGTYTCTVVVDP